MSSGLLQQHTWHVIPLLIPVVATAVVFLPDIVRARYSRLLSRADLPSRLVRVVCAASLGAAAVHVAVTPEHFRESTLYGGFFLLVAVAQLGTVIVLAHWPTRLLVGAVVASNTGLVLLWLLTRTVGIPLGPQQGTVESWGVPDLLAVACELVLICAGTILWRQSRQSASPPLRGVAPQRSSRRVARGFQRGAAISEECS